MIPVSCHAGSAVRRRTVLAVLAPAVALVAAACGGSSATGSSGSPSTNPAAATASAASYPVTVTAANGQVTVKSPPKRIVSLSPTLTEMLYAIGAGSQVVAVDSLSNHPAQAPRTKLSAFHPNAEAVVNYAPDLVVFSHDSNGLLKALEKLGVTALLLPAAKDLPDSYTQQVTLGQVTGHPDQAAQVVKRTQTRVAAAVASVPRTTAARKVYHEIDQTYYSATSGTFLGSIYTMFGLQNIADGAKNAASSGGYLRLSAEYVVSSAPDLIVLADGTCCGQSPATVARRPAFAKVPAVVHGKVIAIDDSLASRWGPRTADFAEAVARALASS